MSIITVDEDKIRHQKLIGFLSEFEAFKDREGEPILKVKNKSIDGYNSKNFSSAEIARLVILIKDALNLTSISVTEKDFNLFALLNGYLVDEEKRKKINEIIL